LYKETPKVFLQTLAEEKLPSELQRELWLISLCQHHPKKQGKGIEKRNKEKSEIKT
jgi:hypothetical protein